MAERYLSQARGHCAVLDVHVYLFEPKIPWWEWIQGMVEVWDPVQKQASVGPTLEERRLGAMGLSIRPELVLSLGLGAALVTAASVRHAPGATTAIKQLWPKVLNHAARELGKKLAAANELQRKLERLVNDQLAQR